MKKLLFTGMAILLSACQQLPLKPESTSLANPSSLKNAKYTKVLLDAEDKASLEGRKVLAAGREMALVNRDIINGSCWDYASAIFDRAGYSYQSNRDVVIHNTKSHPLAINFNAIQPGDFLSYVNYSYHNIKHSAIFVDWLNFDKKIALMLSYAGHNRQQPARYRAYDLSGVYYVARAHG